MRQSLSSDWKRRNKNFLKRQIEVIDIKHIVMFYSLYELSVTRARHSSVCAK